MCRHFLGSRASVFVMSTLEEKCHNMKSYGLQCPLDQFGSVSPPSLTPTSSQLAFGCGEVALMLSRQQNMMYYQYCSSRCTNVKHSTVWTTVMTGNSTTARFSAGVYLWIDGWSKSPPEVNISIILAFLSYIPNSCAICNQMGCSDWLLPFYYCMKVIKLPNILLMTPKISYSLFHLQTCTTAKTISCNNEHKLHHNNCESPSNIKTHLTVSRSADNFNKKIIIHWLLSCFVTWQYFGLNFCLYFFNMPWGTLSQFYLCRGNEKTVFICLMVHGIKRKKRKRKKKTCSSPDL